MLLPPLYDTGCPFICQIRQWFRNERKLRDVLTIVPQRSQQSSQFTFGCRSGYSRNGTQTLGISPLHTRSHRVPQQTHLRPGELTFSQAER